MSDDIVARLRERARYDGWATEDVLSGEAADEITRLRAENERLREALKPLAAITLWTDKYPDGPLSVGDNQRYIDPQWIVRARAALEGAPEPSAGENNGK